MDISETTKNLIEWIRNWFKSNGNNSPAVIGISGGKDSTVCAKLLVEALGKDRVIGVLMPNGKQIDIDDSKRVCEILDIKPRIININKTYDSILEGFSEMGFQAGTNPNFSTNTPARIRMTVLYGISAIVNGRVCNTTNLSEKIVGYGTIFGDVAGDFSPLGCLTKEEVVMIGDELKLPKDLVHKVPSDGMSGKSDEDNLGITYKEISDFIRNGVENSKVLERYITTEFKRKLINIPSFVPKDAQMAYSRFL